MNTAPHIIIGPLAVVLLTAAALKGWQPLAELAAKDSIWSYRPFLVFHAEFALTLAVFTRRSLFNPVACFKIPGNDFKKSGLRINQNIKTFALYERR